MSAEDYKASKIEPQSVTPQSAKLEQNKTKRTKQEKEHHEAIKAQTKALNRHADVLESMDFSGQKEIVIKGMPTPNGNARGIVKNVTRGSGG